MNKHDKLLYIFSVLPAAYVIIDILSLHVNPQVWLIISLIRPAFMVLFIAYIFKSGLILYTPAVRWLLIFIVYIAVLIPNSMDVFITFEAVVRAFVIMSMFIAAYSLVRTKDDLLLILNGVIAAVIIINIELIFAQIFRIGTSPYIDGSFYTGGGGVSAFTSAMYGVIVIPLRLIIDDRNKWLVIILVLVSTLFIFLLFKRVTMGALVAGVVVYFLLTPDKSMWISFALGTVIILMMVGPLFYDSIIQPYYETYYVEKVESRTQENPMTEGKFDKDFNWWYTDVKEKGSISRFLFGTNLGNEPMYYGTTRQIHVDYFRILHGAGIVGFIIYIVIFIVIIFEFNKGYFIGDMSLFSGALRATFYAVIIAGMIISLSGGIFTITHRSILFLLLGSFLGVCVKEGYSNYMSTNINGKEIVNTNE